MAELILPGPNSSGSAEGHEVGRPPETTIDATHSGDPFILAVGGWRISDADLQGPRGGPAGTRNYELLWHATDNVLDQFFLKLETISLYYTDPLGLTGGRISSDGLFGGCMNTQCQVTGFWAQPQLIATPEPQAVPLALIAAGFVGLLAIRRKQANLSPRRNFRFGGSPLRSHHAARLLRLASSGPAALTAAADPAQPLGRRRLSGIIVAAPFHAGDHLVDDAMQILDPARKSSSGS